MTAANFPPPRLPSRNQSRPAPRAVTWPHPPTTCGGKTTSPHSPAAVCDSSARTRASDQTRFNQTHLSIPPSALRGVRVRRPPPVPRESLIRWPVPSRWLARSPYHPRFIPELSSSLPQHLCSPNRPSSSSTSNAPFAPAWSTVCAIESPPHDSSDLYS